MMLYFPVFLWSFAQMYASLMYLIIFFFLLEPELFVYNLFPPYKLWRSLPSQLNFPWKYSNTIPDFNDEGDYFIVIGIRIKLWRILFKLSDFVHSPPIFCIYHCNAQAFEGPSARDLFFFLFYEIYNVGK